MNSDNVDVVSVVLVVGVRIGAVFCIHGALTLSVFACFDSGEVVVVMTMGSLLKLVMIGGVVV